MSERNNKRDIYEDGERSEGDSMRGNERCCSRWNDLKNESQTNRDANSKKQTL